jgi:hypothetical protein
MIAKVGILFFAPKKVPPFFPIGDFGLSRRIEQALYTSQGGLLPIKWMAIESLKQMEFSTKSDV